MDVVKVEVEVSKEAQELADAIKGVVVSVKEASKDGFHPLTDIPAVVVANLNKLIVGLAGVEKLPVEVKESASKVGKPLTNMGWDLFELLKAAPAPAPVPPVSGAV